MILQQQQQKRQLRLLEEAVHDDTRSKVGVTKKKKSVVCHATKTFLNVFVMVGMILLLVEEVSSSSAAAAPSTRRSRSKSTIPSAAFLMISHNHCPKHHHHHHHQQQQQQNRLLYVPPLSWIQQSSTAIKTNFSKKKKKNFLMYSTKDDDNDDNDNDNDDKDELRSKIRNLISLLDTTTTTKTTTIMNDKEEDDKEEEEEEITTTTTVVESSSSSSFSSIVYLIGTGISNRLLDLPLSTLEILISADVILYDALSLHIDDINAITSNHCIIQGVGKRGGDDTTTGFISMKQNDIDELLLYHAMTPPPLSLPQTNSKTKTKKNTKIIVRLKGGDPFIFGRSRSEIETLRTANNNKNMKDNTNAMNDKDNKDSTPSSITYHVIPNLSSCIAGPHMAGIPLTDPYLSAQSFAVFSGTTASGMGVGSSSSSSSSSIDFNSMTVDTLIFLMIGRLDKLDGLCQTLIHQKSTTTNESETKQNETKNGRWNYNTPCAVIRYAGRPEQQQTWRATLGTLLPMIRDSLKIDNGNDDVITTTSISPAILVVGPTANLNLLSSN